MQRYDPPKEIIYDDIRISDEGDSETLSQVSQTLNSVASDRIFDFLIDQADKLGASDIHIEPAKTSVKVRYRIDGVMQEMPLPPKRAQKSILSRLQSGRL